MRDAYLEILDEGYYETKFAFEGLQDSHVWQRPAAQLLSIGEIAGHLAYWQAVKFAGVGGKPRPDLTQCRVSSLLIDHRFQYYTANLATPPSPEHLALTSQQVYGELIRVYSESISYFKALNPDLGSSPPGWPPNYTYKALLTYAAVHISYHVGQMYSVRHLLGEAPPDN